MKHRSNWMSALLDKVAYLAAIKGAEKNNLKKVLNAWDKKYHFNCIVYSLRETMSACTPVPMPKSVKGMFSIRTILILFLMMFSFHMFSLSAQTPRKDSGAKGLAKIIPLKIGDTIPEELWNMPLEIIKPTAQNVTGTLADYRNQKLLILDFWNTWCKSCIKLFPKVDSLNAEFNGRLSIVPVSNDPSKKVIPWMRDKEIVLKSTNVLGDNDTTGIGAYFPRKILPHVVIIADNKVKAITFPEYINRKNLNDMLHGRDVLIKMKYDDLNFNPRYPLFVNDLNGPENNFKSRSIFSGLLDGIPSMYLLSHDSLRNRIILKMINNVFMNTWVAVYPEAAMYANNQIIYPSDQQKLMDSVLTYELIFPADAEDRLRAKVKSDLESYFGWTADTAIRDIPTLVFVKTTNASKNAIQDLSFNHPVVLNKQRMSLRGLIYSINMDRERGIYAMPAKTNILFDEKKEWQFKSLKEMNRWLKRYGITATIEMNRVKQLIIRKL